MSELWAENEMDSDVKREIENKCNLLAKKVCAAHGNLKEKGTRNSTREKWMRNINRDWPEPRTFVRYQLLAVVSPNCKN